MNWRDVAEIKLRGPLVVTLGAEQKLMLLAPDGTFLAVSSQSLALLKVLEVGCSGSELYRRAGLEDRNSPGAARLADFLSTLQDYSFLGVAPDYERLGRRKRFNAIVGLDLFKRFPVPRAERLSDIGRLFRGVPRWLVVALSLLVVFGAVLTAATIAHPSQPPSTLGLFTIILVLLFQLVLHEVFHAIMMGYFGLKVKDAGVGLMFYVIPAGYVDRSSSVLLQSRVDRVLISLAGPLWDMAFLMLIAVARGLVPSSWIPTLIWLQWFQVVVLVTNLNPFTRSDGSYALEAFLGLNNLRTRAFRLLFHDLSRRPAPSYLTNLARAVRVGYYAYVAIVVAYILFLGYLIMVMVLNVVS